MILSLDTNVLVDVMRLGRSHIRQRIDETLASGTDMVVSTIVAHELVMGAQLSARPQEQLESLGRLLADFRIEPWGWEDAMATGRLRAERERLGRRLTAFDTLIGGQALARGWTLVTADLRDFWEIDGLRLLDWSNPDEVVSITGGLSWFRPPPR